MTNTSTVATALSHTGNLTMSSREIADLTGKRHDNVMADIKKMLTDLNLTSPDFLGHLPDGYQRPQPVYFLPKRETLILISGYNIELRARIIDRWQELEAAVTKHQIVMPNFEDPAEAAIAWAEQYRQAKALTDDVNRLQKTCNTLADQFAIGMTPCQFARQLNGVNIRQVMDALYKMNWLFKQGSDWMVAAYARDKYLKQEMGEIKIREGVTRVCPKATLTKKGAKAIYKMYIDGKLPMKSDWDGHQTHILFSDVA